MIADFHFWLIWSFKQDNYCADTVLRIKTEQLRLKTDTRFEYLNAQPFGLADMTLRSLCHENEYILLAQ